jgi:hypothetical protein
VGKVVIGAVVALLLSTAGCLQLDVEDSPVTALIFPPPMTPTPTYVDAIGTPAAVELPDADFTTWFSTEEGRDPYDQATWQHVAAVYAQGGTSEGWKAVCEATGSAAPGERTQEPLLGALGCSDDPSVTIVQRFALQLLGTQAHTALWIRGVPGFSASGIEARIAELRVMCAVDVVAREGGEESPYSRACALAMDASYKDGDGPATFTALGDAYAIVADEIARRDPTVDAEPAFFATEPATP